MATTLGSMADGAKLGQLRGLIAAAAGALALVMAASASQAAVSDPVGIYLLDETPSKNLNTAAAAGNYDGLTFQLRWSDLQPAADVYDWSKLDPLLQTALNLGKRISIGLQVGQYTPSWVLLPPRNVSYDVATFNWGSTNRCTTASIPRPWDPDLVSNLITTWQHIRAHLAGIKGAVAALTMIKVNGLNLADDQLRALASLTSGLPPNCHATDGTILYQSEGYRPRYVVQNWTSLASGLGGLFAGIPVALDVIPGNFTWPSIDNNGVIYTPNAKGEQDVTSAIVASATAMFPAMNYVQVNTLDMGPIPPQMSVYVANGARLGLQTNAKVHGGASCGTGSQIVHCTPASFAALLQHGISLGAWFIEVHPNDAVTYPQELLTASANLHALHH